MAHTASRLSIPRLVLGPTLFTLGVTLLRLAGELRGWPSPWFDKSSGVVGITWFLPPIFGFYFVSATRTPSCKDSRRNAMLRHDQALKEGLDEVAKAGFRAVP